MIKKNSPSQNLTVAAMQLNSGTDVQKNLDHIQFEIENLSKIPDVLVLPEVFNYRRMNMTEKNYSESLTGRSIQFLQESARENKMHIIGGSIPETGQDNKAYNTSVVIEPSGEILGTYRKMHLFNVSIDGKNINESNRYLYGDQPEIVTIHGWKFGLSICYDLRFPELFRWYFNHGAEVLVIPSSFIYETGKKHWHILCQARAIENQCFVIAPNQCGIGANDIKTYGHSLIVDPMGSIIAEADEEKCMTILADLNREEINSFRENFPIKNHQRKELN